MQCTVVTLMCNVVNTRFLKTFLNVDKITTGVYKSSKMGPHLGSILLERSHFSHCKTFDLQVCKARFHFRKHLKLENRGKLNIRQLTADQPRQQQQNFLQKSCPLFSPLVKYASSMNHHMYERHLSEVYNEIYL